MTIIITLLLLLYACDFNFIATMKLHSISNTHKHPNKDKHPPCLLLYLYLLGESMSKSAVELSSHRGDKDGERFWLVWLVWLAFVALESGATCDAVTVDVAEVAVAEGATDGGNDVVVIVSSPLLALKRFNVLDMWFGGEELRLSDVDWCSLLSG